MSQHATELCLLLVDDVYGGLTSRVFEVLIRHGRNTFPVLLKLSGLKDLQVRHSLAVLIQQHLALWYNTEDSSTFYEADWTNAYNLVRSGKIIKAVEDHFGDFAGGLISSLLTLGHTQIGDLARAYEVLALNKTPGYVNGESKKKSVFASNGVTNSDEKELNSVHKLFDSTLRSLMRTGHISVVHESHFRSVADNKYEAELEIGWPAQKHAALSRQQKLAYEAAVERKLCGWKYGTDSIENAGSKMTKKLGRGKRQRNDDSEDDRRSRKKVRVDLTGAHNVNGGNSSTGILDLDTTLVVRVNFSKLTVILRNKKLAELAEQQIGPIAAQLYAEVLKRVADNIHYCEPAPDIHIRNEDEFDPDNLPGVSTPELLEALKDFLDFAGGIGQADPAKICMELIHPRKRRRKVEEAEVSGEASLDEDSEVDEDEYYSTDASGLNGHIKREDGDGDGNGPVIPRLKMHPLRQTLFLLAEHPYKFLHHVPCTPTEPERWTVDFLHLTHLLRLTALEDTITARYGPPGLRITRILLAKGKLDEKMIGALGLMNQKVMRAKLATMHEHGHLELQEIPRDNQRQPSRNMFFWFFDMERCRKKVVEECYKSMARCLQRAKVEMEGVQTLLEKAERSDVVGREDEFLGEDERIGLEQWREREERLLGEVGRLDELVAVLRDF